MDQKKIGAFIADRRKQQGFTQVNWQKSWELQIKRSQNGKREYTMFKKTKLNLNYNRHC